jgi:hypothetical protein
LLRPDRLRAIERPFGWLPCRLLSGGWIEGMSRPAQLLYPLLAMASDRQGLSFYGDARIEQLLALEADELVQAQEELTDADLLAFDGRTYQLLSLPHQRPHPASPAPPQQRKPPSADSACPTPSPTDQLPEDVQAILHKLLGQR